MFSFWKVIDRMAGYRQPMESRVSVSKPFDHKDQSPLSAQLQGRCLVSIRNDWTYGEYFTFEIYGVVIDDEWFQKFVNRD